MALVAKVPVATNQGIIEPSWKRTVPDTGLCSHAMPRALPATHNCNHARSKVVLLILPNLQTCVHLSTKVRALQYTSQHLFNDRLGRTPEVQGKFLGAVHKVPDNQ